MKKIMFFSLFLIFSLPIFSQENSSDESVSDESEQTESQIAEDKSGSEIEKKNNFFIRAFDWLESLPFSFDLGCEPTDDYGSTVFGSVGYHWRKDISTLLFFEFSKEQKVSKTFFDTSMEIEDSTRNRMFFKFFPFKKAVLMDKLPRHHFSFAFGMRFEYSFTDTNSFLNYQDSSTPDTFFFKNKRIKTTQTLYDIGPCAEFFYSFPIFDWLRVNSESSISACYLHASSDISATDTNIKDFQKETFENDTFESIFFDTKVHLDFFKFIAVVVQYQMEKIPMNYFFYDNSDNVKSEKYNYTMRRLRIGGAFILAHKNYVRIQTGFYRQLDWLTNHSGDTEHTERWVFSVSAGF